MGIKNTCLSSECTRLKTLVKELCNVDFSEMKDDVLINCHIESIYRMVVSVFSDSTRTANFTSCKLMKTELAIITSGQLLCLIEEFMDRDRIQSRKGLSLVFAVKKFHNYPKGGKFVPVTYHKVLPPLFGTKYGFPVMAVAQIQRWAFM
ncbi:hypothetical protein PR048_011641 [Dryococelus australis]|uniref:Uncharacterized protein n=1 Tax=Dryococelus australis TaxID=614101 RepID=A0ABQ9HMS3_9NEOP|nr:hypothetical protein PR048_011641 [Dryococelus australis]